MIFSRIKKCEAVPLICVKDVLSHESCHEFRSCFMLRSSNLNSDPIHRNQDSSIPRKITSNLRIGKWSFSYCWHSSKYVRIIWYFLRYQQWVLPTAAFHCFALHGLHGGSLMSSYCLKFESSCRAAEMKSFGESKLYHVVGLCHIVSQSRGLRLKFLSVAQVW